jgi:putative flippase GtrA
MARPNVKEIVRYGISGSIVLAVDFLLLNFSYLVLRLPLLLAVFISFVAAALVGYRMHSRFSFQFDTRGQDRKKLPMFVSLYGIGLGITELMMYLLTISWHLHHNLAKALAVIVVTAIQYSAMKWVIFRKD